MEAALNEMLADRAAGLIADPEALAAAKGLFAVVDTDEDGFIDRSELNAAAVRLESLSTPMFGLSDFEFIDMNQDGKISEMEWLAALAGIWEVFGSSKFVTACGPPPPSATKEEVAPKAPLRDFTIAGRFVPGEEASGLARLSFLLE